MITLEGLRDFKRDGIQFEYHFVCVGTGKRDMPQFNMYITQGDDRFLLVAARITRTGPKVRSLGLFPSIVTIHNEFGDGRDISLSFVPKEP